MKKVIARFLKKGNICVIINGGKQNLKCQISKNKGINILSGPFWTMWFHGSEHVLDIDIRRGCIREYVHREATEQTRCTSGRSYPY